MDGLFEAIRDYLLGVGCKVEYRILVNAFKDYLYNPNPEIQGRIRTQFKDHVNSLATVSVENNMKFIILRPEFRPNPNPVSQNEAEDIKPEPPPRPALAQTRAQNQDDNNMKPPPVPEHMPRSPLRQLPSYQPMFKDASAPSPTTTVQMQQMQARQMPAPPIHQATQFHRHSLSEQYQHPNEQARFNQLSDQQNLYHQHAPSMQQVTTHNETDSSQMPPPRPPPRRRQSNASLFSKPEFPGKTTESRSHNELNDLAKRSPGKVKERASKLNSHSVSSNLNSMTSLVKSHSMRENRLSRDSNMGSLSSASQRLGYNPSMRSRSSHREDESDSSSFQPMDALRKKWTMDSCNCNYNGLVTLLKEDQRLAAYKDNVGYTALHWAAKKGNLDIIKLIAGTYCVSPDTRSNSGYTPLHLAYMFNRREAINLLTHVYNANTMIRDYSGRRPQNMKPPGR